MAAMDAEYTLYSFPFSLYSMMARHTIHLGTDSKGAKPPKKIELHLVNTPLLEHLSEQYLCEVNPKGQVPALTGSSLAKPLTDSLDITLYLAEKHYPALLPETHAADIRRVLADFSSVVGPSFSKKHPTEEMKAFFHSPAEKLLETPGISPAYRRALQDKIQFHNDKLSSAFHPESVERARSGLRDAFASVVQLRRQNGTLGKDDEWVFGEAVGPTALDSHLLPFILRCVDTGSADLVPEELQNWAKAKAAGPSWKKTLHGRSTVYNPSQGSVTEMKEMLTL